MQLLCTNFEWEQKLSIRKKHLFEEVSALI